MEDDDDHHHFRRRRFITADEQPCKQSYFHENDFEYLSSFEDEQHVQYRNHTAPYYHNINQKKFQEEEAEVEVEVDESNWFIEDTTKPPIGLKLKKTPSLLNLIDMTFVKNTCSEECMADKLKAVTIPLLLLKIGTWQLESRHEGDMVSKCYFAKRKLIWEILEGSLKRKIEMSWSDVIGLHVNMPDGTDNGSDILDIELNQPPSFAQELNPQPRKHTQWKDTCDFTDSQALVYRRHHLEFPPGTLAKLYKKLLRNDERLSELSKNPFPTYQSPYFNTRNEFDQSQYPAGHSTSMVPRQEQICATLNDLCTSLIPPPNSFSTPIPGFFNDYTIYQESSFPFTHLNTLLESSDFAVEEEGGVDIDILQQFDNGNNILFGGVPNIVEPNIEGVPNIVEPNIDLPPLPENTFLAKTETPGGYNSFSTTQDFNKMSSLLGSTVVSDEEGVNQMNSLDEAILLTSRNSVFPSLDHQGSDVDEQIIAMLNQGATLQDLFCLLPQLPTPTANNESYNSGFADQ